MKCLLFTFVLLRFDLVFGILVNYHCGVGSISKVLSYGLSYFCGLNSCCSKHDECYYENCENTERGYRICDSQFESCIRQAYGFICGPWLKFTHVTPVRTFGSVYRSFSDFTPSCRKSGWEQVKERLSAWIIIVS
ncbi:hypothetical protein M3Y99_01476500 [Aphelenchoides fujianensis]|nr:hypothetical protein M3Y99_01476500 [Aphelenchoides fujianensis]